MKTVKGQAIFLAQFAGDAAPFNSLSAIASWAAGHGYQGVQIPSWDGRLFDLKRAAESKTYADEVAGICAEAGVRITELSTHLQGQLVAVHPAYDAAFDGFAAPGRRLAKAEAVEFVRDSCSTFFHCAGTAKMGTDALSVCDPRLNVRGVAGLSIADASVIPILPSCNTHAPVTMIAERAADFLTGAA